MTYMGIDRSPYYTENYPQYIEIITNIWLQKYTGYYYFSDETEGFNGPYKTIIDAQIALRQYCKECLGTKEYSLLGLAAPKIG